MRSVLEHLVWGLAFKDKGSEPSRSTSFPIYRTEKAFWEWLKKAGTYSSRSGAHKIVEITDVRVWAAIEQLQPYKSGHDDLYILNELARTDRHQSLRVMGGVSDSVTYGWRKRGVRSPFAVDLSFIGDHVTVNLGPFEHDAVIGHFVFNEPEMEVDFKAPRYVAFRDAGPATGMHVLGTLTNIRRHIESVVIPKLEGFF